MGLTDAWGTWVWIVAFAALGGTFLLTSSSEKYRSVTRLNYPKRQFDGVLAYLAAGRDVRMFLIAVASVAATYDVDILLWALVAIAAVMHVNFGYRVVLLRSRMEPGPDRKSPAQ